MRIGFNFADIKTGGQYHGWLQDLLLRDSFHNEGQRPRAITKKEIVQGKYVINLNEEDTPNYSVIVANKDNIYWDGLTVYIEVPSSVATNLVPAWFEDPYVLDEEGNPTAQRKTFQEYGSVVRTSLDTTKIILKVPNVDKIKLNNIESVLANKPTWEAHTIKTLRVLLENSYNVSE